MGEKVNLRNVSFTYILITSYLYLRENASGTGVFCLDSEQLEHKRPRSIRQRVGLLILILDRWWSSLVMVDANGILRGIAYRFTAPVATSPSEQSFQV